MQFKQKYIDIVQKSFGNATAFFTELTNVGNRLGIPASWIADVMYIETAGTFSPSIKNPKSTATGLIQFIANTATGLGTTVIALARMSNIQQLAYVEKYFRNQTRTFGMPKEWFDVYLLVFYPAWVGKPDTAVMDSASYSGNSFIDTNKDKKLTRGEFKAWANKQLPNGAITTVIDTVKK